jgi:putative membrane protein (TIGR04086 family)
MLWGIVYTIVIVLAGSLILALLLEWTTFSESQVPVVMYVINGIALLYGGFIAGRRSATRGWLSGALSGLGYALVMLIIGFLAFDMPMSTQAAAFLAIAVLLSALGGVLGINTAR